jgi:flagellar FliJ protein
MPVFRLQSLLKFRQQREDQLQQELGRAKQKEQVIGKRIEVEKDRLQRLRLDLESRQTQGVEPQALRLFEDCFRAGRLSCRDLEVKRAKAKEEIELKRQALAKASQDKKILEKLKKRHEQALQDQARRAETAAMDEIAAGLDSRALAFARGK